MVYTDVQSQRMYCLCYQSPEMREQNFVDKDAMNDIEEAEIISKDFILVKFRYRDEYFHHLNRGSDYKLKLIEQN